VTGTPIRTRGLREPGPASCRASALNVSASSYENEERLLEAARNGDEDAFWLLVEPHRT
jgi:hypothetical protein